MSSEKKNVLVYRSSLLPPSETFIQKQVSSNSGFNCTLVGEFLLADGLDLSKARVILLGLGGIRFRNLAKVLGIILGFRPFAFRKIKAVNPDLIHVHFATDAVDFWPVAKRFNIPYLVTLHGYDIQTHKSWWESGKGGLLRKSYPRRVLDMAACEQVHFIAVSSAIKRRAIEFGIPESKITVSHIGIDTSQFSPSPIPVNKRRDVLFVGRLVEKKGCRYLLEAFAKVQEQYPESRLKIVGDGPLRSQLESKARELNLRVDFLGALPGDDVASLMRNARVFCLPSIRAESGDAEGFGMVILEAQSSGVPVITSADGGREEGIIDGETGFSHEPGSVSEIAKLLDLILSDDVLAERLSDAGPGFVREKLDLGQCTKNLARIYSGFL